MKRFYYFLSSISLFLLMIFISAGLSAQPTNLTNGATWTGSGTSASPLTLATPFSNNSSTGNVDVVFTAPAPGTGEYSTQPAWGRAWSGNSNTNGGPINGSVAVSNPGKGGSWTHIYTSSTYGSGAFMCTYYGLVVDAGGSAFYSYGVNSGGCPPSSPSQTWTYVKASSTANVAVYTSTATISCPGAINLQLTIAFYDKNGNPVNYYRPGGGVLMAPLTNDLQINTEIDLVVGASAPAKCSASEAVAPAINTLTPILDAYNAAAWDNNGTGMWCSSWVWNIYSMMPSVSVTPAVPSICTGFNESLTLGVSSATSVYNSGDASTGSYTYTWNGGNNANVTGISAGGPTSSASPSYVVTGALSNSQPTTQTTTYQVTVSPSDYTSCSTIATGNVSVSPQPSLGSVTPTPICPTAILTTGLTGGVSGATYTYNWTQDGLAVGGSNNSYTTLSGLSAGSHTYAVTATSSPNDGCAATVSTSVTVAAQPSLTPVSPSPFCPGTVLSSTLSGGASGTTYNYTWTQASGTAGSPSGNQYTTATNLATGSNTYGVTATSSPANGCSAIVSTSVSVVQAALTAVTPAPICPGAVLSSILSSGVTGTSYNYSWTQDGSPVTGSGGTYTTLSGLSAGSHTYTVTATSSPYNNCSASVSTNITVAAQPGLSAVSPNPICPGSVISTTLSGGAVGTTYTYNWTQDGSGVGGTTNSYTTSTGISAGSHTYAVTATSSPNNGCAATVSTPVTVAAQPALSAVTPNPVCPSAVLSTTLTGGASGTTYNYTWAQSSGTAGTPSGNQYTTASGLSAGPYTYSVTANSSPANGCSATVSTNVTVSAQPTLPAVTPNPICPSATLTTTLSGGATGTTYNFGWTQDGTGVSGTSSGNTANYITLSSLTSSSSGTSHAYVVTATSSPADGCHTSVSTSISAYSQPSLSAVTPNPVCPGSALSTLLTGGTPSTTYNYSWTQDGSSVGGNSTSYTTSSGLSSGAHSYVVTANSNPANGCAASVTTSVTASTLLNLVIAPAIQNLCVGSSGQTITPIVATTATTATYTWANSTSGSLTYSPTTGPASGTTSTESGIITNNSYPVTASNINVSVTATDGGCTSSATATINVDADIDTTGANPVTWVSATTAGITPTVTGSLVMQSIAGNGNQLGTATYNSPLAIAMSPTSTPGCYNWGLPSTLPVANGTGNSTLPLSVSVTYSPASSNLTQGYVVFSSSSLQLSGVQNVSGSSSTLTTGVQLLVYFRTTNSITGTAAPVQYVSENGGYIMAPVTSNLYVFMVLQIQAPNPTTAVAYYSPLKVYYFDNAGNQNTATSITVGNYYAAMPYYDSYFRSASAFPFYSSFITDRVAAGTSYGGGFINLNNANSLNVSATVTPGPACGGSAITLTPHFGTISLNCPSSTVAVWSGPSGFTQTSQTAITTTAPIPTSVTSYTYSFNAINNVTNVCYANASTTVTVNPTPVPITSITPNPICVGNNLSVDVSPATAGTYSWNWTGPSSFTSTSATNTISSVQLSNAGTYNVTVTNIANSPHCAASTTGSVTVNQVINVTPVFDNCDCIISSVHENIITLFPSGGTSPYTFSPVNVGDQIESVIDATGASHPGSTSTTGVKGVFLTKADGLSHGFQVTDAGGCSNSTPTVTTTNTIPSTVPTCPTCTNFNLSFAYANTSATNTTGGNSHYISVASPANINSSNVYGPALPCHQTPDFGNNWVTYVVHNPYNPSDPNDNTAVAEVNDYGHNLDSVAISVFRETVPVAVPGHGDPFCSGLNQYALDRHYIIQSTKSNSFSSLQTNVFANTTTPPNYSVAPSEPYIGVRLYFSDVELWDLITQTNNGNPCEQTVSGMNNIFVTKFSGIGNSENAYYTDNSGGANGIYRLFGPGAANPITNYDCNTCGTMLQQGGATYNTVSGHVTSDTYLHYVELNVTEFSEFWLNGSQDLAPLPVNMLYVDAEPVDNAYIQVSWATAQEINNNYFVIQRSLDSQSWDSVGIVQGHGTTTTQSDYSYNDYEVAPNVVYYYRLKQVDVNGNYVFTEVVSARILGGSALSIGGFIPNPTNGSTMLVVTTAAATDITMQLFDILGRKVTDDQTFHLAAGGNRLDFDYRSLASGTYTAVIINSSQVYTKRLVISR